MKLNLKRSAIIFATALCIGIGAKAENVAIHTPANFQVLSMSPNAKWACGVFATAGMDYYAFRWNLESGSIEVLSTETSVAWDVSDDGTVSGEFADYEASGNGAPINLPGYWRDGKWHHLELPEGNITDGIGGGISPDGHSLVGSLCIDGIYTPYIWKDGKLSRKLQATSHAVAYAVSPDGEAAGGYCTMKNRTACYWAPDGTTKTFLDSPNHSQTPWNAVRNFSPDGKKLVYWGGWLLQDEDLYLYTMYDIEKQETVHVKTMSIDSTLEFLDISNDGVMVGSESSRGYLWTGDEGKFIDDYLSDRNVDLSTFEDFYSGTDYYKDQLPIFNVVSISGDGNVLACQYYNANSEVASMIVKIDQDVSSVKPVEVSAKQLDGVNTVALNWKRPVDVSAVRGYYVYRNGTRISGFMPLNVPYFYDKNLADGTYSYEVSAITVAGNETRCEAMTVDVSSNYSQRPLSVTARQKGYGNGLVTWRSPMSNIAHKHYYNPENTDKSGFAIYQSMEVEMAISFDKGEMNAYKNYKITEVSFIPMAEHYAWSVNLYSRDSNGALELILNKPITQQLNYGVLNTVTFDTPVDVPDSELIVAIAVNVNSENYSTIAAENTPATNGKCDLLRQMTDDNFFSTYESSVESGYDLVCMSWVIDLGLTPDTYSAEENALSHYNIYVNEKAEAQTSATQYIIQAMPQGHHNVAVEAVYTNGNASLTATSEFDMHPSYPAIENVTVVTDESTPATVNATWDAPVDNDVTDISYVTAEKASSGIHGVQENGYALMIAAKYPAAMLSGYNGYEVKSLRFYPLADALFTMMLYKDDKLVSEVEVDDFTLNCWNEVALPESVIIDDQSTYMIVLDCFDPEPAVALVALDDKPSRPYYSELYSIDNGETWNSLFSETSAKGNWLMGMVIADPTVTQGAPDGYDVVIDGIVRNTSRVLAPSFTYTFDNLVSENHTVQVNSYYPLLAEAVDGNTVKFHIPLAGIEDSVIASLTLRQGNNMLVADGYGVQSIEVLGLNGARVAMASSDSVDISHLSAGMYIVTVRAQDKNHTFKINVTH